MPHLPMPSRLLSWSNVGSDYRGHLYRARRIGGAHRSALEAYCIGRLSRRVELQVSGECYQSYLMPCIRIGRWTFRKFSQERLGYGEAKFEKDKASGNEEARS